MLGDDEQTGHLFSRPSPEQRVPADHPLRAIRTMTDAVRSSLNPMRYGVQRTKHAQVREDLPQPITPGQGRGLHATPPVSCAEAVSARLSTRTTSRAVRRDRGVGDGASRTSDV